MAYPLWLKRNRQERNTAKTANEKIVLPSSNGKNVSVVISRESRPGPLARLFLSRRLRKAKLETRILTDKD